MTSNHSSFLLETERLVIRSWKETDLAHFINMCADPVVMEFFPKVLTREETTSLYDRIQAHEAKHGFTFWAVEEKASGEFLGFTGLAVPSFEAFFTPCVEIGWRLKKDAWGKGYATEAASACLQYGFDALKLNEIVSFTAELNIRSSRVMQKIGMTFQGYFEHPKIEQGSPLRRHVLYVVAPPAGWQGSEL